AFLREPSPCQIANDTRPDSGQRASESNDAVELGAVADFTPRPMIDVLTTPARVSPHRLNVAARAVADPDVRPGGRDDQSFNPPPHLPVQHRRAVWAAQAQTGRRPCTRQAGLALIDIVETGSPRSLCGQCRTFGSLNCDHGRAPSC